MTARGLLLCGLLMGCPAGSAPPSVDPPVAQLAGQGIRQSELLQRLRSATTPGEIPRDGDGFGALRSRIANEYFVEEVLLLEAQTRELVVADERLDAELVARFGDPPDPEAIAAAVARIGSDDAFRALVRRRLLARDVEDALRVELADGVAVTPEQVAAARERFQGSLTASGRVRARQLFSADPEEARAWATRIAGGEEFLAVAGAAAGNDGDMGWMTEDAAPSLLLEATRSLPPGGTTDVLRSPLGYHIFQLVARRPALAMGDEAAAAEVERRLREETVESRLKAWVAARTEELGLVVHEDAVAGLRCCREGDVYIDAPEETR